MLTIISLFATRFWSTPTQRTLSVARPSARSHRYHLVTKASGCFVLPPPRSPRYGGCNKENTTTKRGRLATEKHLICCIDPTAWLLGPSGRMQRRCFGNLVVPQDEVTFWKHGCQNSCPLIRSVLISLFRLVRQLKGFAYKTRFGSESRTPGITEAEFHPQLCHCELSESTQQQMVVPSTTYVPCTDGTARRRRCTKFKRGPICDISL